jgi:hypothetical protein
MTRRTQCGLVVAVTAALIFTYGKLPEEKLDRIPGTGPISQPHPVTLRVCAKDVIVRAVIDDGLSLPEAAALCGEIYRLIPDPPGLDFELEDPPADRPPPTDEERLCRRVIDWVAVQRQAEETVARLEAEYREWRSQGTGRLPNPAGLALSPADLLTQARVEWSAQCRGRNFRAATAASCDRGEMYPRPKS